MLVAVLIGYTACFIPTNSHWVSEKFVSEINSNSKYWKARINHLSNFTEEELKNLANIRGYHPNKQYVYPIQYQKNVSVKKIPLHFDSREHWNGCHSISTIRDQGKCGASWAFAAVEVMSDRLCTASNNLANFIFSPEELIGCCKTCGNGCNGGYIFPPFEYWILSGIPSGGDDYSSSGCKPYSSSNGLSPSCLDNCTESYNTTLQEDLRHGVLAYRVYRSEAQIQIEIMHFGPVVAVMDAYADFYVYGEGVYDHISWDLVGRIAVKIIGWGEENKIPYWLVANSWGQDYGEKGYVKVLRGSNHCGIEYEVTAATPNIISE